MKGFCPECGKREKLTPSNWRCECGGAWEFEIPDDFDSSLIDKTDTSIWRYRKLFALEFENPYVCLGAGWTPLLPANIENPNVLLKLDYLSPTSSFKDRGTSVMINIMVHQGVTHIADDSSGNAGASIAAYSARANMRADIYVPDYASPSKQSQIKVYGAEVHPVTGARKNAKLAALNAVQKDVVLASHAYHPGFLLGQQTVAWEIWEQLGYRVPDCYIVPVGQGVHLLGVWLGFKRLMDANLIDYLPRLIAVQPKNFAPVCHAFDGGLNTVNAVEHLKHNAAEGLAIDKPVRGQRILQAIRDTNGECVTVTEDEIFTAQRDLAKTGFFVEPTSATAVAAQRIINQKVKKNETVVISLTGSGLKGTPVFS
jgi:threonine synthase